MVSKKKYKKGGNTREDKSKMGEQRAQTREKQIEETKYQREGKHVRTHKHTPTLYL